MSKLKKGELRKNVIVDRETWLRGQGSDVSFLLRTKDGKMCCLGQLALQCGFSKKEISNKMTPIEIGWKKMSERNRLTTLSMMEVNDNYSLEEEPRESRLKALFKCRGMKLKFIN